MFMQRPSGQSQFSAPLQVPRPSTPALREVADLVSAQPALDHSARTMAARAGVSARHLARLFATELDTTPARYVEQVRLDHAKALLDAGHGVAQTARLVGFGSSVTMRRVFVARFGVSPASTGRGSCPHLWTGSRIRRWARGLCAQRIETTSLAAWRFLMTEVIAGVEIPDTELARAIFWTGTR